jgi:hypothetical protein
MQSISEQLQELVIKVSFKFTPYDFLLTASDVRVSHDNLNVCPTSTITLTLLLLVVHHIVRIMPGF